MGIDCNGEEWMAGATSHAKQLGVPSCCCVDEQAIQTSSLVFKVGTQMIGNEYLYNQELFVPLRQFVKPIPIPLWWRYATGTWPPGGNAKDSELVIPVDEVLHTNWTVCTCHAKTETQFAILLQMLEKGTTTECVLGEGWQSIWNQVNSIADAEDRGFRLHDYIVFPGWKRKVTMVNIGVEHLALLFIDSGSLGDQKQKDSWMQLPISIKNKRSAEENSILPPLKFHIPFTHSVAVFSGIKVAIYWRAKSDKPASEIDLISEYSHICDKCNKGN